MAVYYGASYYIEIFSARYQKQFDNSQHIQQVAQTAAKAAYSMAQLNRSLASEDNLKRSPRAGGAGMSPVPVDEEGRSASFSRTSSNTSGRGGTPMLEELDGGRTSRSSTIASVGGGSQGDLQLPTCPEEDPAVLAAEAAEWERTREAEAHEIIAQTTTAIVNDLMLKGGDRPRLNSDDTEESEETSDSDSDSDSEQDREDGGSGSGSGTGMAAPGMMQCMPDEDCYIDLPDDSSSSSGVGVLSSKLHNA
jgi:hypothetical protein